MSIIEKSNSGRLTDEEFTQIAELLGCEPAALKASGNRRMRRIIMK